MAKRYIPVEEKSYRPHFVICSLLLFGVTAWAIWDETYTRRPWKKYQVRANRLQMAQAEQEAKANEAKLQKSGKAAKLKALQAALAAEKARLDSAQVRAQIAAAKDKLVTLTVEKQKTAEQLTFAKSIADELNYYFSKAVLTSNKAHDPTEKASLKEEVKARKAELAARELEVAKVAKKADDAETAAKKQKELVQNFYAKRDKLVSQIEELRKPIIREEKKLEKLKKFSSLFSPEIKQLVVNELDRVDRCQTCHVMVNSAGFEKDTFGITGPKNKGKDFPQPYATHPRRKELLFKHPVAKFGCTACHMGQGRALTVKTAHAVVEHESHGKKWKEPMHYWDEPLLNIKDGSVYAGCRKCHNSLFEIPGAPTLNEGKALFVELGCHGCHNTGLLDNLERVGPELAAAGKKLNEGWMIEWLKSPKKFRPTTKMPNFRFTDAQAEAIAAYLVQQTRDATDRGLAKAQAAAKKAGRPFTPPAASAHSGRALPSTPGMTDVATRYSPLGESPVYVQVSSPPAPGKQYSGKELIEQRGCLGCHMLNGKGDGFAPELNRVGEKIASRSWLIRWITNPRSYDSKTAMPNLRLPPEEVERIADYLMSLKKGEPSKRRINRALAAKGKQLIRAYGCFGCHLIPGMEKEGKIGIELNAIGAKSVEQLDFGFVTDIPETWEHWIKRKLKNPRAYETNRISLKMPVFETLDQKKIDRLVVWLRSLRGEDMHPAYVHRLSPRKKLIEHGREVVRRYNCNGCHIMEGKGGDIRKLYSSSQQHMAPPNLDGEGQKVKSDWLFSFLKRPFVIRPWFQLRMPTFQMSDKEARALTAYFASLDKAVYPFSYRPEPELTADEVAAGRKIFTSLKCVQCHPTDAPKPGAAAAGGSLAPNLTMASKRLREDWIVQFIQNPQALQKGVNMPQFWAYDDSTKKFISPLPKVLGGDSLAQMAAVRDYIVYRLGRRGRRVAAAVVPAAPPPIVPPPAPAGGKPAPAPGAKPKPQ